MTIKEASEMWGLSIEHIRKMCNAGRVPAKKEKTRNGWQFVIPDGTERPKKGAGRGLAELLKVKRENGMVPIQFKEKYIAKYGGSKSVKTLADELQISRDEVRTIYENELRKGTEVIP